MFGHLGAFADSLNPPVAPLDRLPRAQMEARLVQIKDLSAKVQETERDYREIWNEKKAVLEELQEAKVKLESEKERVSRHHAER